MIRAVIFDFDGVIANSEPLHFAAFRDILSRETVALTERDYYQRYLGFDDAGVFEAVARDQGIAWNRDRIRELLERKAARLEELERLTSMLFPGAEAAIRRLSADVPLGIASGAIRPEIERVLERAGLRHLFGAIVAAGDTARGKPAPDPYIRAVSLLSAASGLPLEPHECVAIEDSRWGLQSARSAGLRTVAVAHTYSADELLEADLVIPGLEGLSLTNLHSIESA